MSTTMVATSNRVRRTPHERRTELFHEIRTAAREVARHRELDGLLRVVCRELLPTLTGSRREEIETFENPLRFVMSCLRRAARSADKGEIDPFYLIGRIEALLDLCVIATDQLVAASVIERVKNNKQAIRVLCRVSSGQEVRRAELAAFVDAESEQAFSNLLRWMEDAELIRRRTFGREKMIGLGAKGEAAFCMLRAEYPVAIDELRRASDAHVWTGSTDRNASKQSRDAIDQDELSRNKYDTLVAMANVKPAFNLSYGAGKIRKNRDATANDSSQVKLAYAA